jgi:hypothetical protein
VTPTSWHGHAHHLTSRAEMWASFQVLRVKKRQLGQDHQTSLDPQPQRDRHPSHSETIQNTSYTYCIVPSEFERLIGTISSTVLVINQ